MADSAQVPLDTPDSLDAMSPAEHLDHAHRHTLAAGQHVDLAATHIQAASATDGDSDDGGGSDGSDGGGGTRSAPGAAARAGAQYRTGFPPGTGAARSLRAATGRR